MASLDGAGDRLDVFIVAGEASGDVLGAELMASMSRANSQIQFAGVGGPAMTSAGLTSHFLMSDIAVMGFLPVLIRLPLVLRRIRETADACIAANPDVLVIIDSPDFTHRVARRVRAKAPHIPIVNYVSPTVWAWREGRARKMSAYIDHVLAVLPFEPAVHRRLGGPECTYVGHPLVARLAEIQPGAAEATVREHERRILLLPGSRTSEVSRLMPIFRDAVANVQARVPDAQFILPAVPHLVPLLKRAVADWTVKPQIIEGQPGKLAAFRTARAALAASGTVTLELALAKVPMVAAYKVSRVEETIVRALVKVSTPILASLILGRDVVPFFLQDDATPDNLADTLVKLVTDSDARRRQLADFEALEHAMHVPGNAPSVAAADIVLRVARAGRQKKGA